MEDWVFIMVIIFNLCSWILFLVIQKSITHITANHIEIIGRENQKLVRTSALFWIRIAYGIGIFTMSIIRYFIFS